MTTTDTVPTPIVEAPETPTTRTIEDAVLEEAHILRADFEDLPMDARVFAANVLWIVGELKPNDPDFRVFGIFSGSAGDPEDHIAGDARIYATPTRDGLPFMRYTSNRTPASGYVVTQMSQVTFVRKVAFELERLAVEEGVLKDCYDEDCEGVLREEENVCPDCGLHQDQEEPPESGPNVTPGSGGS